MKKLEGIMDKMPEDMRRRAEEAVKAVQSSGWLKALWADPEAFMPTAECKICKEDRKQDLVAMGPGIARFVYYPCQHSSNHEFGVESWYNEEDERVEV